MHFLQGIYHLNQRCHMQLSANLSSTLLCLFPTSSTCTRSKIALRALYKTTPSIEMQRCRAYFTPINAELERKLFCFTFCVCVSETNSVLWKHSLPPVGAGIFICVYICWCVYICIQCKGCIYSLHAAGHCHFTALPEPAPCHSEAHGLPPHRHQQGLHPPGRPECGNKTVNVQDLAAFLLVYKLSERKK